MTKSMDAALDACLGKNNVEVYCISLPHATDRRRRFEAFASSIGMTFSFWNAIDKQNLTPEDLKMACVRIGDAHCPGASACRLSIHQCLESFYQHSTKDYILILEDDAGFETNGRTTPSSSSEMSNLQDLIRFLEDCCKHNEKNPYDRWLQVWFGYYDDDRTNFRPFHTHQTEKVLTSSLAYQCLGTSCTHAMLFRRDTVELLLFGLLRMEGRHLPIDWFTKTMMADVLTLIPPKTIIAQTDDYSYVHSS